MISYQLNDWKLIWKPHGIASSFGESQNIFDLLNAEGSDWREEQKAQFTREQEWGLCNRLDVPTAGLIVFAQTQASYEDWIVRQTNNMIQKTYITDVHGHWSVHHLGLFRQVVHPIGHHSHLSDRMILPKIGKGKPYSGNLQEAESWIEYMYYDEETNTTTLRVTITKGVRHQIRVHLASLGHPIVGDKIYGPDKQPMTAITEQNGIHLWSMGLVIDDDSLAIKP